MIKLLEAMLRQKGRAEITVTGVSMEPALREGDRIEVRRGGDYAPGDTLVYPYKGGELLVHRLLKKEGRCFCKGDNAFRLEDVEPEQIFGRVAAVNGVPAGRWPAWKIDWSYRVNRMFIKCRYDPEKTKQTEIWRLYRLLILGKGDETMKFRKNKKMDYIQADETSLAVFDPESGDTHFFDETGIDILNLLDEPRDLEELLKGLCEIYDAPPEEIRGDVQEFLAEAAEKKVVELL